jgi:hypothetical protein
MMSEWRRDKMAPCAIRHFSLSASSSGQVICGFNCLARQEGNGIDEPDRVISGSSKLRMIITDVSAQIYVLL